MLAISMMMGLRAARLFVAALSFVAASRPLRETYAALCPTPAGAAASLGEQDSAARLQFLRDSLRETARQERGFALAWGLTYVGLAGGSWALLAFSDDPGKIRETYWNTATSISGGGLAIIQPLLTIRDHRLLEKFLAEPRSTSTASRCTVLAEAERLLAHAAKSEDGARRPLAHLMNIGVSISLGLVMAYGLKRPDSAPLNTVMGLLIGEMGIATRPLHASRSLGRYRQGTLIALPPATFKTFIPSLFASNTEYRVTLTGAF